MNKIQFTYEQHDVKDYMILNDGIVLVAAGAGTGKSWLSKQIAIELNPTHALYTAFNKAIVLEGEARFDGLNVDCCTFHKLARDYVKAFINVNKLGDISYSCIKEDVSYLVKYQVITAIDMFYVSASIDMYEFMENYFNGQENKDQLVALSVQYIELMVEGKIDPTFNFLLKYFHLLLVEGTVNCQYDLVILDEINDVTAVTLEIFKLIKAPKKLGLGETHQAIYDFLNLVNGFEELEDVPIKHLTQSFRCSERIAEDIQTFMRRHVTDEFTFVGTDEPVKNNKYLYCTMTNASIVQEIDQCLYANKGFHLLRDIKEIFALPLAITSASMGKKVYQKKYKHLEEEYVNFSRVRKKGDSFYSHLLEHVGDQETKSAVNLLLSLHRKEVNIFDLYRRAKEAPVDLSNVLATVYTSKGLEFETVHIADDINARIRNILDNGGIQTHEDLVAFRCAYVAASRAGENLQNAKFLNM